MPTYRLNGLGGLSLTRVVEGGVIAATQKSRLAMLTVIAASGQDGIARDKVATLFWPDSDSDRSRNAMNQALFGLRRGAPEAELVEGIDELRFNRQLCEVDFLEFEAAIARNDFEAAIQLYAGPFLEGSRLRPSVGLEKWIEAKRSDLEGQYSEALRLSSRQAGMRGDNATAIARARLRSALMPHDALATIDLVRALCASGSIDLATRQVAVYERLVSTELGAVPDPRVSSALKDCTEVAASGTDDGRARGLPPATTVFEAESPVRSEFAASPLAGTVRIPSGIGRKGYVVAALLLMALVIGGLSLRRTQAGAAENVSKGETIAVFPFCISGSGADEALSNGLVDLITASLPGDAGPRPLDARATISAASRSGKPCQLTEDHFRRISDQLGASHFISGKVVVSSRIATITTRVVRNGSGEMASHNVISEGNADSLHAIVGGLTNRIQAIIINEPGRRMPDILSRSTPALQSYLRGRAFWRSGQKLAAVTEFLNALEADSTFALAALGLSEAGGWAWGGEYETARRQLLRIAGRSGKLSSRDQALFDAANGNPLRRRSSVEELRDWERAITLAPDAVTAWHEYGDRLFHIGASIGRPNSLGDARKAFDKAIALDSGYSIPLGHLIELAIIHNDRPAVERYAKLYEQTGANAEYRPFIEWRLASYRGDVGSRNTLVAQMGDFPLSSLRRIAGTAQLENTDADFGMQAIQEITRRSGSDVERLDGIVRLHDRAINDRNWTLAETAIRKMEATPILMGFMSDVVSGDALRVTDVIFGGADSTGISLVLDRLERSAATKKSDEEDAPRYLGENCVLAIWYAPRDTLRTRVYFQRMAGITQHGDAVHKYPANPAICHAIARSWTAVRFRRGEAAVELKRLDSLSALGLPTYGGAFANLATALLYEGAGDGAAALRAVRRRRYEWTEAVRYLETSRQVERRLMRSLQGSR